MMRNLKLGAQLNISFALVLFVPLIIAAAFSIIYYSNKIREEAINTISSDLKIASIIYQNTVDSMRGYAESYARKSIVTNLLGFDLGEKIGASLSESAKLDNIDMITIIDSANQVLVRSHAPEKIGAPISPKEFSYSAFKGETISGTEIISIPEMEEEGIVVDPRIFSAKSNFMAITGAAPVYDKNREYIQAVIIVRRIIGKESNIIERITSHLDVHSALFEGVNMIVSGSPEKPDVLIVQPPPSLIKKVIVENKEYHQADISKGGGISKFRPVHDFKGRAVGVLMVQTDVEPYIKTRNTAILSLIGIFLTGFVLAFSIKTLIERRILLPVYRLKQGTEYISKGEYDHELAVTSGDEIGELTAAFNKMGADLLQYDRQLKEYNSQLEERVKDRTKELELANEKLQRSNSVLEETLETLNPGVSRLIESNRQQLGLVFATELVADICNYTKMNMILGETLMGDFMKLFFRECHKLLARYKGMFDKTVGDQIVAIFGIPKDSSEASKIHTFDSVMCAMELIHVAEQLNYKLQAAIQDNYNAIVNRRNSLSAEDRQAVKIEDLKFMCRVGVNTSNPASTREIDRMRMVMMGAETCVDYTAQGGAIIYAFRLESNGVPGEVHIGENTRRLIEHVFLLEELPQITLKGLGAQSGYRVIGRRSIFENIYPKTRFYDNFLNRIPDVLIEIMETTYLGRIQLHEVKRISEYIEVDIHYLEHSAGVYNFFMSRALFSYAAAMEMNIEEERRDAVLFASIWTNAMNLLSVTFNTVEPYPVRAQIPENLNSEIVEEIIQAVDSDKTDCREAEIIRLCDNFDELAYDRTYLQTRVPDLVSSKAAISRLRTIGRFSPEAIDVLEKLMISETEADIRPKRYEDHLFIPKDPKRMAEELRNRLKSEERLALIANLRLE